MTDQHTSLRRYTLPAPMEVLFHKAGNPCFFADIQGIVWDTLMGFAAGRSEIPHRTFEDRVVTFFVRSPTGLIGRFSLLRIGDDTALMKLEMVPPQLPKELHLPEEIERYVQHYVNHIDTTEGWHVFGDLFRAVGEAVYRIRGYATLPPPPDRSNRDQLLAYLDIYYPNDSIKEKAKRVNIAWGTLRNWYSERQRQYPPIDKRLLEASFDNEPRTPRGRKHTDEDDKK